MNALGVDPMRPLSSKILVNFPQLDGQLEVLDGCIQSFPMVKITLFLDDENDAGLFPGKKAVVECRSNGLPPFGRKLEHRHVGRGDAIGGAAISHLHVHCAPVINTPLTAIPVGRERIHLLGTSGMSHCRQDQNDRHKDERPKRADSALIHCYSSLSAEDLFGARILLSQYLSKKMIFLAGLQYLSLLSQRWEH